MPGVASGLQRLTTGTVFLLLLLLLHLHLLLPVLLLQMAQDLLLRGGVHRGQRRLRPRAGVALRSQRLLPRLQLQWHPELSDTDINTSHHAEETLGRLCSSPHQTLTGNALEGPAVNSMIHTSP